MRNNNQIIGKLAFSLLILLVSLAAVSAISIDVFEVNPSKVALGEGIEINVGVIDEEHGVKKITLRTPKSTKTYYCPAEKTHCGKSWIDVITTMPVGGYAKYTVTAQSNNGEVTMSMPKLVEIEDIENNPPIIQEVTVDPENPTKGQNYKITAHVTDDKGIASVTIGGKTTACNSRVSCTAHSYMIKADTSKTYAIRATDIHGMNDFRDYQVIVKTDFIKPVFDHFDISPKTVHQGEAVEIKVGAIDETEMGSIAVSGMPTHTCDPDTKCGKAWIKVLDQPGKHKITVTITDKAGNVAKKEETITVKSVSNDYPSVDAFIVSPKEVHTGEGVEVNVGALDKEGIANIRIYYNDKVIRTYPCNSRTECGKSYIITPMEPGQAIIKVVVEDTIGQQSSKQETILVHSMLNTPTTLEISSDVETAKVNEFVTLTVKAHDEDKLSSMRTFYNGRWHTKACNSRTECETSYEITESKEGTYTYRLKSTDVNGNLADEVTVAVKFTGYGDDTKKPDFDVIQAVPERYNEGEAAQILIGAIDETEMGSIAVKLGGSWRSYDCPDGKLHCGKAWTYSESKAGTYHYDVKITDKAGNVNTGVVQVIVDGISDQGPLAFIDANPRTVYVREQIEVQIEGSSEVGIADMRFFRRNAPVKTIPCNSKFTCDDTFFVSEIEPGYYAYRVIVTDINGKESFDMVEVMVVPDSVDIINVITPVIPTHQTVDPITWDPWTEPESHIAPQIMDFSATSATNYPNDPITLLVDAADEDDGIDRIEIYFNNGWNTYYCYGRNDCTREVQTTETAPGTYTYYARVFDEGGLMDVAQAQITLVVPPPSVSFVTSPITSVCAGDEYVYDADAVSSIGNPVTYSLSPGPLGMSITPVGGVVRWQTIQSDIGRSDSVNIVADDGNSTVSQLYTLKVIDCDVSLDINPYLGINNVRLISPEVTTADDTIELEVIMNNNMGEDLEDLGLTITIPDLGVRNKEGPFFLEEDETKNKFIDLELPSWTKPGVYDIKVDVGNDDTARIKYVQFTVVA